MRRLLTDLCATAAFLADLFTTALAETARTARGRPATGRLGLRDQPGPGPTDLTGGRARRAADVRQEPRARGGSY